MGLLDEAIREHLDLKRRRGADPEEIERAEREALGPVRRNREASASEQAEPLAVDELDSAYDEEEVGSAYDEPDDAVAGDLAEERPAAVADDPDTTETELEPGGRAFLEDDEPSTGGDEPSTAGDEPSAERDAPPEDEPATRVMRAADISPPSDATAEYDVEAALESESESDEDTGAPESGGGAKSGGEDEDMLEETPEFLQDTPDHDRLWFEQRPPRDFDFDG